MENPPFGESIVNICFVLGGTPWANPIVVPMKSHVYPNFAELSHDSPMILYIWAVAAKPLPVDDQLGDYTPMWGPQDS